MISCNMKGHYWGNSWSIIIPQEVSHYFMPALRKIYEGGIIRKISYVLPDHYIGDLQIPVDKLDELLLDYDFLERNLDEITEIAPLTKQVGRIDGYYISGFITDAEHPDNEIYGIKDFTRQDMLLIISLIKKKILESKERKLPLVFSGD